MSRKLQHWQKDPRMDRLTTYRPAADPEQVQKVASEANRKARFGHKNMILWIDREGVAHNAQKTEQNVKKAMLDTGTQFCFNLYHANSSHAMILDWRMANTVRRNAKYDAKRPR